MLVSFWSDKAISYKMPCWTVMTSLLALVVQSQIFLQFLGDLLIEIDLLLEEALVGGLDVLHALLVECVHLCEESEVDGVGAEPECRRLRGPNLTVGLNLSVFTLRSRLYVQYIGEAGQEALVVMHHVC